MNLCCFGNEKNLCCFGNARLKSLLTSVLCTEFFCEWAAIAIAPLLIPGLLGKLARERKLTGHTSKSMLVPRGHLRGRATIEVSVWCQLPGQTAHSSAKLMGQTTGGWCQLLGQTASAVPSWKVNIYEKGFLTSSLLGGSSLVGICEVEPR